jgi:hypothetical protein
MKNLAACCLFIFFAACRNNEIPKDILSQEKMEKVLWDVLRADEMVDYNSTLDSSIDRRAKTVQLYQQVFKIHNISAQQFKKSFNYYQTHPGHLKPVLDSLRSFSNSQTFIPPTKPV